MLIGRVQSWLNTCIVALSLRKNAAEQHPSANTSDSRVRSSRLRREGSKKVRKSSFGSHETASPPVCLIPVDHFALRRIPPPLCTTLRGTKRDVAVLFNESTNSLSLLPTPQSSWLPPFPFPYASHQSLTTHHFIACMPNDLRSSIILDCQGFGI